MTPAEIAKCIGDNCKTVRTIWMAEPLYRRMFNWLWDKYPESVSIRSDEAFMMHGRYGFRIYGVQVLPRE